MLPARENQDLSWARNGGFLLPALRLSPFPSTPAQGSSQARGGRVLSSQPPRGKAAHSAARQDAEARGEEAVRRREPQGPRSTQPRGYGARDRDAARGPEQGTGKGIITR